MKRVASLKFLAGVVWVMLVFVDEMQGQQQTMGLVESAKSVQDLAHIAVVDALSPLQTALSLLESQWSKLEATANQKKLTFASITAPTVNTQDILACRARSVPKYTNLLKHLVDKEHEIGNQVANATLIANALQFVSQLVANDQIQQGTLQAITTKMNAFVTDYKMTLSGFESSVCISDNNDNVQMLRMLASGQCPDGDCSRIKKGFCLEGSCVKNEQFSSP
eukprot:XP_011671754.1 PREDICTED: sperm-activating peptides isoform X2 [Strongylocentrotus purpuratus]